MTNKELYIKISKEKKGIPLFMQPWWLDTVCTGWDVAIAKKGEHITGVWAYPLEKKIGVSLLRNPMLTPYLGPHVFYPNDLKESNLDNFEHETVAELMKQLPDAGVWHLALQPGMKQVGLFKKYKLKPEVQQTFLLELGGNEETLLANMKDTARRNIRMAEKEIEVSTSAEYLKDLYKFQKNTLTNKGQSLPYSFKYIQKIMDACTANNATALWVAKSAGKIQAIVWQVWDDNCSYYFMGGQNQESGSYKAMTLLLWHTIKEAKKRGHATFDLEGSMDEGVERFFRNFGGERALYIVLHKNDSILWKMKKMILK
jgi:lipid II:glycine glycyltransferase (peptidoglycan interpeptide bridge formation enzyme)